MGAEAAAQADGSERSRDLDLDTFAPVPRVDLGLVALDAPAASERGQWAAGLFFHHAIDPLVIESTDPSGGVDSPIAHRSVLQLAGALSLGSVELGASLPVIQQSGREPSFSGIEPATGMTFGNLEVRGVAPLTDIEPIALGLAAEVALPTSRRGMFAGARTPSAHVRGLAGVTEGPVHVVANAGFRVREKRALADVEQGNEVTYGLGAAYAVTEELAAVGELVGALGVQSRASQGVSPLELSMAFRYGPERPVGVVAGVSRGILPGIGAPSFRGFFMLSFSPRRGSAPAAPIAQEPIEVPVEPERALPDPEDFECADGDGPEQGCPVGEAPLVLLPDRIELFEPIAFAAGSAEILPESYNTLAHVAATLRDDESIGRLVIGTHVHQSGDEEADRAVTRARAQAVRDWLGDRGVARERLAIEALGGEWPLIEGDDERARAVNERVELVIETDE